MNIRLITIIGALLYSAHSVSESPPNLPTPSSRQCDRTCHKAWEDLVQNVGEIEGFTSLHWGNEHFYYALAKMCMHLCTYKDKTPTIAIKVSSVKNQYCTR